jgi:hypothetical protein
LTFCGENGVVMDMNTVALADAVFGHGEYVWLFRADVTL